MLLDLQVKNLALIENAHIEFDQGLNILTGETGAGKSIIIGSVNMALGGRSPKEVIRAGADYAYVELVFSLTEPEKKKELEMLDIFPTEDNLLIISKKIMPSRSISKINDETVTSSKLRQVTSLLIDIHGQHEHQSLLYKSKHLEILDEYIKNKTQTLKQNIGAACHEYTGLKKRMTEFNLDQETRIREADFIRFEIEEIENAGLKEGEEETLTKEYRMFSNGKKIIAGLSLAYDAVNTEGIGRALKEMGELAGFDKTLSAIRDQLYDAESVLNDVTHQISSYIDDFSYDEEEFDRIEKRLDVIHGLQAKYGFDNGIILQNLEEKKKRLEELEDYDNLRMQTERKLEECRDHLENLCGQLSKIRQKEAKRLIQAIMDALKELNFLDVSFSMVFNRLSDYTPNGYEEAEFLISTNPGEDLRPLGTVASGGELSRIMLAIKAVLAHADDIPTLIFDEIDTGISGRTAQMVSRKLSYIARNHQVICITHLPQIAAMADTHFEIKKETAKGRTKTIIQKLGLRQMVEELARLLGGEEITEAVLKNAEEMKELAERTKYDN